MEMYGNKLELIPFWRQFRKQENMGKVLRVREVGDPILKKECDEIDIKKINQELKKKI